MALTKKQLEMRRNAYGASEIAALVGLSAYSGPIDVYERKVLGPAADDGTLATELGDLLEEPVAKVYAGRTGRYLRPVHTLRHATKPLAIATPDRAVFLNNPLQRGKLTTLERWDVERLLQIKTRNARARQFFGAEGTDAVPEDVLVQVQWEMAVAGVGRCDVAVLFRGDFGLEFAVYTVEARADLFANLYELVERFHVEHVLAKKPPPLTDKVEAYDRFLRRAYPSVLTPHLVATEEVDALLLRWAKLKEVSKRVETLLDADTTRLREVIGSAEGIISQRLGTLNYRGKKPSEKVDWQQAFAQLQLVAGAALNAHLPPELMAATKAEIDAIIPACTSKKENGRWFQNKLSGEAKYELQRLELALEALTKQAEENPNPGEGSTHV